MNSIYALSVYLFHEIASHFASVRLTAIAHHVHWLIIVAKGVRLVHGFVQPLAFYEKLVLIKRCQSGSAGVCFESSTWVTHDTNTFNTGNVCSPGWQNILLGRGHVKPRIHYGHFHQTRCSIISTTRVYKFDNFSGSSVTNECMYFSKNHRISSSVTDWPRYNSVFRTRITSILVKYLDPHHPPFRLPVPDNAIPPDERGIFAADPP